jgi:hypothetical protein
MGCGAGQGEPETAAVVDGLAILGVLGRIMPEGLRADRPVTGIFV